MPARRHRPGELGSRGECRSRLPCRSVIPGLKNLAEAFGITLRPTAGDRRVVVHENIWTVSNRFALEQCIYEDEELAVLITGRVKIFVVVPAKLPIVEKSVGVAICGAIGVETGRQQIRHGSGFRPEFNVEEV